MDSPHKKIDSPHKNYRSERSQIIKRLTNNTAGFINYHSPKINHTIYVKDKEKILDKEEKNSTKYFDNLQEVYFWIY